MEIIRTVKALKQIVGEKKALDCSIGLVPTMGALHQGHLSLIDKARKENDIVVSSIFVNPTQFNNKEDLRTYPRSEEEDCQKLSSMDVDIAFIPSVEEMYPEPDTRVFDLGPVAEVMEGAMRPGHFNGVAQIVSKLFRICSPDRAYFGEKDLQQIAVIRRMACLENFYIQIVPCPIVREKDGLAMSSRNQRLTPAQRASAPGIYAALRSSLEYAKSRSLEETKRYVVERIDAVETLETEYYEIVDPLTMQPIHSWDEVPQAVGCVAAYCGEVRLIDNIKYDKQ